MDTLSAHNMASDVLRGYGVEIAYLFGSRARGDDGPLSDADVAVLFSQEITEDERFARRLQLASRLAAPLKAPRVDTIDLEAAPPGLAYRVITEGRLLFSCNDLRRVRFEARTYQRYVDLKPFLAFCERRYLQALGTSEAP